MPASVLSKEAHISGLIHELADVVVNWGGYADDAEESAKRSRDRDALAALLRKTIAEWNAK